MAKPYRPYKLTLGFSDKEILELRKGLFTEINKQAEDIKKAVGIRFLDLPGGHLEKFDDIKELKEAANRLANFIAQQEAVLSGVLIRTITATNKLAPLTSNVDITQRAAHRQAINRIRMRHRRDYRIS